MKTCTVCGVEKPISEFFKRTYKHSIGTSPRCKACDTAKTYAWRMRNPQRTREIVREHYSRTREEKRKVRARQKQEYKERKRKADPTFAIGERMSGLMRQICRGQKRGRTWEKLAGYSAAELRRHIERQFCRGMSWENMSEWEIDHIIPLASFGPMEIGSDNFRLAWSMTNLRPLWRDQNRSKWAHRTLLL